MRLPAYRLIWSVRHPAIRRVRHTTADVTKKTSLLSTSCATGIEIRFSILLILNIPHYVRNDKSEYISVSLNINSHVLRKPMKSIVMERK